MHVVAGADVVASLIVGGAEAGRRVKGADAAHGIVAPLDAAVILLHPVIQVAAGAMATY